MSAIVTDIVERDPDASNPVLLLNFGNYLWQLFNAKGFRARDQCHPSEEFDGTNVLFVAGEKQLYRGYIGGIDVAGSTANETAYAPQEQMQTYVAKRNRATGTMRLVEVSSCQLNHVSHDRRPEQQSNREPLDRNKTEKLLHKFDSKSTRATLKRRHGQHFDLGVMEQKLRKTIADCVVTDDVTTVPTAQEAANDGLEYERIRTEIQAKANANAKSLRDLYRAEDLIGLDVLRRLTEAATLLLQIPPEDLSMANGYLDNRVKALMQSKNIGSERDLATAGVCLFMDALARLIPQNTKPIRGERCHVSPFAPALDEPIRQRFFQYSLGQRVPSDRTTVTKYTRHKALVYYLALAFVLEESSHVSAKVIHQSLQIPKQELITFARAVGAMYSARRDVFTKGNLGAEGESSAQRFMGGAKFSRSNRR